MFSNVLFRNNGDGRFTEVAYVNDADRIEDGRGLAVFDYDEDGRLDLALRNFDMPATLLHNRGGKGHWVRFDLEPLVPASGTVEADIGAGRMGLVGGEASFLEIVERVKSFLSISNVKVVGSDEQTVLRVAIACGSGGSFLSTAIEKQCDCLVTGETSFHTCLEAEARGVGLILPGHFASERFALLSLADYLQEQISGIEVWASRHESDPLRSI